MAIAPASGVAQEDETDVPKPFIVALDPKTGDERWRQVDSEAGVWHVIGEADGIVYVQETRCQRGLAPAASFVARDTQTGKVKWREPARDLRLADFSVGGGTIVVVGRDGVLRGLDPANGRVVWEDVLAEGVVPVAGSNELILLAQERLDRPRELRAVDRETGATRWVNSSGSFLPASPLDIAVVRPDTAVVESGGPEGGQASVDLRSGRMLWEKPIDRVNLEAESGWRLLFASFVDGQLGPLHAYAPRTREERWVAPPAVGVVGPIAMTKRLVVTLSVGPPNRYVALDAATGTVEWERDAPGDGSIEASGHGLLIQAPHVGTVGNAYALDDETGDTIWTSADPEGGLKRWLVGESVYVSGGCLGANPG